MKQEQSSGLSIQPFPFTCHNRPVYIGPHSLQLSKADFTPSLELIYSLASSFQTAPCSPLIMLRRSSGFFFVPDLGQVFDFPPCFPACDQSNSRPEYCASQFRSSSDRRDSDLHKSSNWNGIALHFWHTEVVLRFGDFASTLIRHLKQWGHHPAYANFCETEMNN